MEKFTIRTQSSSYIDPKNLNEETLKLIEDFYPRWEAYVLESNQKAGIPKAARLDDMATVTTQDGEEIDMKHLRLEMESAKTAIVSQSPLFAPYVHNFTPIYTWLVPTMATDGIRLFVNPKFANDLSWKQKIFVIIHEIMHCVLLHMERLKGRDPKLFNIAGDLEINPLIVDTITNFDEAFVKELQGLYDEKYLNEPVEAIYADIKKNMPPMPPPPSGTQGSGQGQPGSCPSCDGSGEKSQDPGEGEGEGEGEGGEGQGEGGKPGEGQGGEGEGGEPGEGKGGGGGEPCPDCGGTGQAQGGNAGGAGSAAAGAIYKAMAESDPAGTGGVISQDQGEKIAEESGYDVQKGEAGPDINAKDKWNVESAKLFDAMEKSKQYGSGKGKALLTALSRIHRGEVNWKNLFRRYVATALSPEVYQRLGNKKHLGKEYFKYGERQKMDALEHIIVLVDVSGSMSQQVLERILGEVNSIIFSKRVKKITVAFFDDGVDEGSVQSITKYSGKPYIPKNVSSGGGTNFQTALDWVKEKYKDRVSLLVFMTDGYAPMPSKPKYHRKFIWVLYDNPTFHQPFGKMINLS